MDDDVEVFTHVKLDKKNGRWNWYQECLDKVLPNSRSSAPKNASPWLPLRFVSFDGEAYGRGRVEEFLGDLKSLEALSQALIEGSAAAAKLSFLSALRLLLNPRLLLKLVTVQSFRVVLMMCRLSRLVRQLTSRLPMRWLTNWVSVSGCLHGVEHPTVRAYDC